MNPEETRNSSKARTTGSRPKSPSSREPCSRERIPKAPSASRDTRRRWPPAPCAVPVSYMGIISMIISAGTVVSSLCSDRLTRRLGAGGVTALSVGVTAAALLGFSVSRSFLALCLWAVPYGLGAGSVDAALNNYVALHYTSRHMSWLHCMWGIGASLGPYAMTFALAGGQGWNMGYRYISFLQIGLTVILVLSLGLWKGRSGRGRRRTGAARGGPGDRGRTDRLDGARGAGTAGR